MRLVQVEPYYNPPHMGGMEIRARERAERLADRGWIVETLTSAGWKRQGTVTSKNTIVRYLRSWEIARTPIIFGLPIALLRVPRNSVVQVETAIAFSPEIAALICGFRKMPFIARVPLDSTGHGKARDAMLRCYKASFLRWVFRNASAIIVLTEDDVNLVAKKYGVDSSKIRVIPNATDFTLATSPRRHFHEPFKLLFVGRVAMQKNLPLLLSSLRYFIDTYAMPIELDLVGDGEDMGLVRKLIAQLSLQEHVRLKGYVTGEKLEELYEMADCFVMSSVVESFPQVLLEAMAKGLPVVAGNIIGVRTVVADGETGLLVDLTKESLAAAWHGLITERGLYEKLSAGSLESGRKYSWNSTVDAYLGVYNELSEHAACGRGERSSIPGY